MNKYNPPAPSDHTDPRRVADEMADEGSTPITASRRRASSAPSSHAPPSPLENDDILAEILLRLPPRHASLRRASHVCRRWRRVAADPAFLRRFRARSPTPPLLGFFKESHGALYFTWVVDPPGRRRPCDLAARFFDLRRPSERWSLLGIRHGLLLLANRTRFEAVVWDPAACVHHRAPYPPEFKADGIYGLVCNGAVACAAAGAHGVGDCHLSHFKVVLVRMNSDCTEALGCLYESKLGTWGSITSTAVTSMFRSVTPSTSVMVGNVIYWLLRPSILEFDLDSQRISATQRLPEACMTTGDGDTAMSFQISRTEDGELGLVVLCEMSIKLWAWKVTSHGGDGSVEWTLEKTIDLEQLLGLTPAMLQRWHRHTTEILGFDEDNNVIFIVTAMGALMIQPNSNQFTKLPHRVSNTAFPYTSFYIKRRKIGDRDA